MIEGKTIYIQEYGEIHIPENLKWDEENYTEWFSYEHQCVYALCKGDNCIYVYKNNCGIGEI
jgi:hypothetical protein